MTVVKIGSFKLRSRLRVLKKKKKNLPIILGKEAKNFFLASFRKGGFTDTRFKKWQPRRKRISRTQVSATETEPANLIKSNALRGSIRVREATFKRIRIATSVIIYAKIHNEGLPGLAFGKNPFVMPKRKFMGNSKILEKKLTRTIIREFDKIIQR